MGYTIYEQSTRSLQQTLAVLASLRRREAVTAAVCEDIRRRRRTGVIALQTTFTELKEAFITPIDREDLWLLRQTTEAVLRAAEDIVLTLYRCGKTALPCDDTARLTAVEEECRFLCAAVEAVAVYPRLDAAEKQLNAAEKQHEQCPDDAAFPWHRALHALSDTCRTAAERLRYILLKMS